ncbi:DUF6957 family protein [Pseudomonas syringae]|uniref:DUF6957 family protein n=1 Tax=Pseudomonas syringae TaxID=317 RepID=UPI000BB670C2|nr:hypothetical protein [Pseudomonas syringae]PBP46178.1 hypothetical protein CCL13_12310 [Pseudomonas syringae]
MPDIDVLDIIGPSAVMQGSSVELHEAIRITKERFPGQSFCVVEDWVWLDLDAPDLITKELASEGHQPVMLLVFNTLYDSSASANRHWFRSTPLIEFSDGMFFQTTHKLYVLLGPGRRKSMSLSAVVRLF